MKGQGSIAGIIMVIIAAFMVLLFMFGLNPAWDDIVNAGLGLTTYTDTEELIIRILKPLVYMGLGLGMFLGLGFAVSRIKG